MQPMAEPSPEPVRGVGTLEGLLTTEAMLDACDEVDEWEDYLASKLGVDPGRVGGTGEQVAAYKKRRDKFEATLDAAVYTRSKKISMAAGKKMRRTNSAPR